MSILFFYFSFFSRGVDIQNCPPGGAGVGDGDEAVPARERAAECFTALVHFALVVVARDLGGVLNRLKSIRATNGVTVLRRLVRLSAQPPLAVRFCKIPAAAEETPGENRLGTGRDDGKYRRDRIGVCDIVRG